jgi:hypothetical protein
LDYLVNVDYNDGLSNEYQEWTYDDAGNCATDSVLGNTWTYDNLNRMSASPSRGKQNVHVANRGLKVHGRRLQQRRLPMERVASLEPLRNRGKRLECAK